MLCSLRIYTQIHNEFRMCSPTLSFLSTTRNVEYVTFTTVAFGRFELYSTFILFILYFRMLHYNMHISVYVVILFEICFEHKISG